MLTAQKTLNLAFKIILPRLILSSFSQTKSGLIRKSITTPFFIVSEQGDRSLKSNFGYGMSQVKNSENVINKIPIENYLKKIQKTVETIHCYSLRKQT